MIKRAGLYLRQSKSNEEGIERQEERTRALANLRQWAVANVYIDDGLSASKARGAGSSWARLLEDAKAKRVDVVIAVDLDRLLRSTRDLNTLIDAGLAVVTVDGEIDLSTADGEFRASMLASIARFEVRRKGERQQRANHQRAVNGRAPKGVRLTGYTIDGDVIDSEADTVREMFNRIQRGETLKGIASWLAAEGIKTRRGGEWNPSTLRTLLMNPRYAGRSVYRGEIVADAAWEAIVTPDQFDIVQAILTDPRRVTNREGTARKHLGSGLFICGVCDQPMSTNGRRYWCRGHMARTMDPVDELVLSVVRARLRMPDLTGLLQASNDEDVARLRSESAALHARLAVIEADYDSGLIDGRRYAEASQKVRVQLEAVDRERAKLSVGDAAASVLSAPDPAAAFDAESLAIQRLVIAALMRVRLLPVPRGRRGFDPETVAIDWQTT